MEHRQQQKVRREWRALLYTRTVGAKRQKNVSPLRDTHVVLSRSPGVDPRPMELLYAVLLFLVTISVYLCNWHLVFRAKFKNFQIKKNQQLIVIYFLINFKIIIYKEN